MHYNAFYRTDPMRSTKTFKMQRNLTRPHAT